MILNVSGRTDIVAFYTKWFMRRYHEGFVDVRNPFYPNQVSRIRFENVDLIFFCTKNPLPIIQHLKEIHHPILFHVTLTPYRKEIEPNVPSKKEIIAAIQQISKIIGIENIAVRYDPIFLSEHYTLQYHEKAFERMCFLLNGSVEKIIVSFLDNYKNVQKNHSILKERAFNEKDYREIGRSFSAIAKKYQMTVQTCFEERNLSEYGFKIGECLSKELAYKLTSKKYPKWTARKGNHCHCVQMVDIGAYNSCKHLCKYCYANYDEEKVYLNSSNHQQDSSLLIGTLSQDDIIKERI